MHFPPCPLGLRSVEIRSTNGSADVSPLVASLLSTATRLALTVHACLCSYILITIGTGTEPTNKLWYIEVASLPKKADGGLDMSSYNLR